MTEPSYGGGRASFINYAKDSNVDAMIGVVHGDANFYKVAGESPTPQDKYQVGRNYLDGNMPRQAESLIREAFVAGLKSTEVSYYWALAVLSGRPFDHLNDTDFDQLGDAFAALERRESGEWATALGVVFKLLQSRISEDRPDPASEQFGVALEGYRRLPAERRAELRRHLDMIISGGIQDRLEAQDANEVRQRRMGNGRRDRAWMFFEQRPLPARKLAVAEPESTYQDVALVVGGGVLALLCLLFGGRVLVGASVLACAASALLWLAGAYLVVRHGSQRRSLAARLRWTEDRFGRPSGEEQVSTGGAARAGASDDAARPATDLNADRLRNGIATLVAFRFAEQKPADESDRDRWWKESKAIRATLTRELASQYADLDPRRLWAIDWLVRWHADKVFSTWRNGRLFRFREELAVPKTAVRSYGLGIGLVAVGLLVAVVNATAGGGFLGFLAAVGCGAATVLVGLGVASIDDRTTRASCASSAAEQRLLEENKAFADWRKKLEDKPTDAQMAAWLDYDKAHIKALAMKHFRLANRDLIAHVVLTSPASFSDGARVLYGPPRYSDYEVQLFLLTDDGLSQYSVQLDFLTGAITNERRVGFQYNSISSTVAKEVSVRVDGTKEDDGDDATAKKRDQDSEKLLLAQELTLTLDNTQTVRVLVRNFDTGLVEQMVEDPEKIFELARDTSGLTAAVRVLEAIGREGRDWVNRERQRRLRRILDYQQQNESRRALQAAQDAPTPPFGIEQHRLELE